MVPPTSCLLLRKGPTQEWWSKFNRELTEAVWFATDFTRAEGILHGKRHHCPFMSATSIILHHLLVEGYDFNTQKTEALIFTMTCEDAVLPLPTYVFASWFSGPNKHGPLSLTDNKHCFLMLALEVHGRAVPKILQDLHKRKLSFGIGLVCGSSRIWVDCC